jgi:hypothetical protein
MPEDKYYEADLFLLTENETIKSRSSIWYLEIFIFLI